MISILVTLLIFGVIVVVHEFGHFIIAKKNGILVEEFAIGMGPALYSKQKGDTLYSLRAFPIGGYCKMLGEDEEIDDKRSFTSKTVGQRIAVVCAGAIMNFILAYIFVAIILSTGAVSTKTIQEVGPDTPAEAAGLLPGDKILKFNGKRVYDYNYLTLMVNESGGRLSTIVVDRDGVKFEGNIRPSMQIDNSGEYKIGVIMENKAGLFINNYPEYKKAGLLETLGAAFWNTIYYVRLVLSGLGQIITFNVSPDELAGPIGVGQVISSGIAEGQSLNLGLGPIVRYLMNIAALLSANLAVFNLLPVPALDGGRLVFLVIEGIRRKPIDPEKEGMVHFVGLMVLLALSVFVAFKDVVRFF